MNTRRVMASLSLLLLTLVLAGCAPDVSSPEPSREYAVAPDAWSASVRALDPVSVYTHNHNTVVVLEVVDGVEYGTYITTPESSYRPESGHDGFTFASGPIKGSEFGFGSGVFEFKRVRD
jgi:hypothetical protein